jgi:hypothetical protein
MSKVGQIERTTITCGGLIVSLMPVPMQLHTRHRTDVRRIKHKVIAAPAIKQRAQHLYPLGRLHA